MEKTTITLTYDELRRLAWFLDHFTDYMANDDRLDHGWNILKQARDFPQETKIEIYTLAGKLKRRARNLKQNGGNGIPPKPKDLGILPTII